MLYPLSENLWENMHRYVAEYNLFYQANYLFQIDITSNSTWICELIPVEYYDL
jgi:hypothetical protein